MGDVEMTSLEQIYIERPNWKWNCHPGRPLPGTD
jgi:hypothetical protein